MRVDPHYNLPPSPPSHFTGTSSEDGATFVPPSRRWHKNMREVPENYEGGKNANIEKCHLRRAPLSEAAENITAARATP
jgi:hypothetical protein